MQDMNEACRVEHQAPGYTFLHDFALTPTHYVLVQNPVGLQPINFLLGKESAAASVKWQDGKPAEIHHLGRPRVTEPDSATGAATINKQQHQQSSCPGTAVGVSHGHAALDGVFDSVHQQQQQQQQQQQKCHWQQQETGSSRHQPEHLVSEVGLLGAALTFADWFTFQAQDSRWYAIGWKPVSNAMSYDQSAGSA